MIDQSKTDQAGQQVSEERRAFLAKAGKVATAAPAAALLLAATATKSSAVSGFVPPP
jgi:hypothetical protein